MIGEERVHILISNDDGIEAPGLRALVEEFSQLPEVKITVVAPHLQRSASSHSLTFHSPLRVYKEWQEGPAHYFAASGTPTDCIMLGVYNLCGEKPDCILTGINRGANMGFDVSYSATVSSALEGIVHQIPAMAVSLVGRSPSRYAMAAAWAHRIFARWRKPWEERDESRFEIPSSSILSVNVPDIDPQEIKGVSFTSQGRSIYHQSVQEMVDPWGGTYYWIHGELPQGELTPGSDFQAMADKYVSVSPLQMQFTDGATLEYLRAGKWEF